MPPDDPYPQYTPGAAAAVKGYDVVCRSNGYPQGGESYSVGPLQGAKRQSFRTSVGESPFAELLLQPVNFAAQLR